MSCLFKMTFWDRMFNRLFAATLWNTTMNCSIDFLVEKASFISESISSKTVIGFKLHQLYYNAPMHVNMPYNQERQKPLSLSKVFIL